MNDINETIEIIRKDMSKRMENMFDHNYKINQIQNIINKMMDDGIILTCGNDMDFLRDLARYQKAYIKEYPMNNKKEFWLFGKCVFCIEWEWDENVLNITRKHF